MENIENLSYLWMFFGCRLNKMISCPSQTRTQLERRQTSRTMPRLTSENIYSPKLIFIQWMLWISIQDLVQVHSFMIHSDHFSLYLIYLWLFRVLSIYLNKEIICVFIWTDVIFAKALRTSSLSVIQVESFGVFISSWRTVLFSSIKADQHLEW